ncbi:uncharacterized protein LOC122659524 [Telopea speciosissima]|uniref:uncharacterized protein LOC122659524 n=1 Tax=Telopea speciosissima TaxID=54955 RepID=UPI001CC3A600|nr:uncharacterized protein LOC122659524 [Telopea speciosissima]
MNCDASIRDNLGGYGAIGHNMADHVVFALAGALEDSNIVRVELRAIMSGLKMASALHISQVQVQSDSLMAVQMVLGRVQTSWYVANLVEDIRALRNGFRVAFSCFTSEINFADFLAASYTLEI